MMTNGLDNPAFDGSPSASINSLSMAEDPRVDLIVENETDNIEMVVVAPVASASPVASAPPQAQVDEDTIEVVHVNGAVNAIEEALVEEDIFARPAALMVRNACKSYQKGSPVLNDFNMTVPEGTIYSLLGSSGCGKTTMLSSCVGIRRLDSGEIKVFGHNPGTRESGVPGRRVGYMPQELSLYNELSIRESLNFYGRIYGMDMEDLRESTKFLVDFLDLPRADRRVGSLSGGQKRRVSIALALIHKPELLILDEPTVGVDPLLRESIWNHLVNLAKTGQSTVIITTHYVDEARQSNVIGIMRNGRLLAEKSPAALLREYNVPLLEDIVLQLCREDRAGRTPEENLKPSKWNIIAYLRWRFRTRPAEPSARATISNGNVIGISFHTSSGEVGISTPAALAITGNDTNDGNQQSLFTESPKPRHVSNGVALRRPRTTTVVAPGPEEDVNHVNTNVTNGTYRNGLSHLNSVNQSSQNFAKRNGSTSFARMRALLIKNFIVLLRSVGFLLFIFLVPAVQVILICLTIGSDPKGLLVDVVNPEYCDFTEDINWRNVTDICPVSDTGRLANKTLSCFYLALLPIESYILARQPSEREALARIQNGYTYGYIEFPKNYTDNVICRFGGNPPTGCGGDDVIWKKSNIMFELDMSNKQIGQTMKRIFVDTYSRTMEKIRAICQNDLGDSVLRTVAELPYTFKTPVYGMDDTSFREFLAPSILLGLLFFFPLCSSGVSYITEKKTGTLDRALVAGVSTTELMGGFLISQVGILLGQAGFAFIILTQVFQIQIMGTVSLALFLTIIVGISGMSAGFLLAIFCTEEVHAVLLAIGTFFPNILLAGMVWPLEGMERGLQYVSYMLPCTLACEAMRSIISRGWGLFHRSVWPGFASTIAWIVVYWVLALIVHKIKTRT